MRQCELDGFFLEGKSSVWGEYSVKDITPKAHEFLANTRNNTNWKKTKKIAKAIGVGSLVALKDIAATVATEVVKKALGVS